jgi:predicted GNAT family acetyltransferase
LKSHYLNEETRAAADLMLIDEKWFITRIHVPSKRRGKGYATALLKQVLHDADVENVTLWLWVFPSGGLDFKQLKSWYTRYGFISTSYDYMKREPHGDIS